MAGDHGSHGVQMNRLRRAHHCGWGLRNAGDPTTSDCLNIAPDGVFEHVVFKDERNGRRA